MDDWDKTYGGVVKRVHDTKKGFKYDVKLDEKTRFKYQESFENDEMQLELKFRDERELSLQLEKISVWYSKPFILNTSPSQPDRLQKRKPSSA